MALYVHCTCGKHFPIPEQFAGQAGQCPSCKLRFAAPAYLAALGRPALPADITEQTAVSLYCACGQVMAVPQKYAGRQVRCQGCQQELGVPRLSVPEENQVAAGDAPVVTRGPQVGRCRRCSGPLYQHAAYCSTCGANPVTGLTHPDPDAQEAWLAFQSGASGTPDARPLDTEPPRTSSASTTAAPRASRRISRRRRR